MSAGNFGQCGDLRVCNGLIVGGKTIIDGERNLKGLNSIKAKAININGPITQSVVASEDVSCGNVLVVSSTADRQVENSKTSRSEKVIGIAASDAMAGQNVDMIIGGEFKVRKTGTIPRNRFLRTTSSYEGTVKLDTDLSDSDDDGNEGTFAISTANAESSADFVWARFKKSEVY